MRNALYWYVFFKISIETESTLMFLFENIIKLVFFMFKTSLFMSNQLTNLFSSVVKFVEEH